MSCAPISRVVGRGRIAYQEHLVGQYVRRIAKRLDFAYNHRLCICEGIDWQRHFSAGVLMASRLARPLKSILTASYLLAKTFLPMTTFRDEVHAKFLW